jgi:hypothetical protein
MYLSPLAAHDELQHREVVVGDQGVDLCEVIKVRGQESQVPLDDSPPVDQVLEGLGETDYYFVFFTVPMSPTVPFVLSLYPSSPQGCPPWQPV